MTVVHADARGPHCDYSVSNISRSCEFSGSGKEISLHASHSSWSHSPCLQFLVDYIFNVISDFILQSGLYIANFVHIRGDSRVKKML